MTFRELVETHYPTFTEEQKDADITIAESFDDGNAYEASFAIATEDINNAWGHAADYEDEIFPVVKKGVPYFYC
jgi:hypothetical protein